MMKVHDESNFTKIDAEIVSCHLFKKFPLMKLMLQMRWSLQGATCHGIRKFSHYANKFNARAGE